MDFDSDFTMTINGSAVVRPRPSTSSIRRRHGVRSGAGLHEAAARRRRRCCPARRSRLGATLPIAERQALVRNGW